MTQLDGWDPAYFNKDQAGINNYEDSDELSKRRQRQHHFRRGGLTESSSVVSSEADELDAIMD
jgi:hypothetical protein